MQTLDGKVAVVTGAASGIGLAVAHRLARERVKLVLVDVETPALDAAERALRAEGATVLAVRADVSKSAELAAAAEKARASFGTVHVICNNAGVGGGGGPMWMLSEADWEWTLSVNLWGVIHGIRLFVPQLLASGEEGHVVNTASMAGLTSTPFIGPYTATKHAVVAISEVLAKELEMVGAKIGVSVLCPGFVNTNISTSERNRPAELRAADAPSGAPPALATTMKMLVEAGQPPEAIADRVVAAILEPRFYILTHPEMKPSIARRMNEVLEERAPSVDPMLRKLLGG
jgi:NAD(P)-dependent dehydrogenase (short-subunit alcohol dehydrogenase family)